MLDAVRIVNIWFDPGHIVARFNDGRQLSVPLWHFEGLQAMDPSDLLRWTLSADGRTIAWSRPRVRVTLESLVFGEGGFPELAAAPGRGAGARRAARGRGGEMDPGDGPAGDGLAPAGLPLKLMIQNFIAARKHKALNQSELGELMGTSQAKVSYFEQGKQKSHNDTFYYQGLEAMGLPADWRPAPSEPGAVAEEQPAKPKGKRGPKPGSVRTAKPKAKAKAKAEGTGKGKGKRGPKPGSKRKPKAEA